MSEVELFQNIDAPSNNPLAQETITSPETKQKSPFNYKDPKIITLIVLTSILVVLLITALVVSLIRRTSPDIITLPQNQNINQPTPTQSPNILPESYRPIFERIQNSINTNEEYLPPIIDTKIGL